MLFFPAVDISSEEKNKQSTDAPCVNLTIDAQTGLKITLKYGETSDCARSGNKIITVNSELNANV